tara:strand:+ start:2741 stop:3793 length:1053 start_codon:yes stop_codon:yes gene_type:complete
LDSKRVSGEIEEKIALMSPAYPFPLIKIFLIITYIHSLVFANGNVQSYQAEEQAIAKQITQLLLKQKQLKIDIKYMKNASDVESAVDSIVVVPPKKERSLLIFSKTTGFRHGSIELGTAVFQKVAEKTGAFTVEVSENMDDINTENLARFDAIMMLNTTGNPIHRKDPRKAFDNFLKEGKGLIGIHAATDCHSNWKEYMSAMGGLFAGHPWFSKSLVTLCNEDPNHPCAHMIPQGYKIKDEIYQYQDDKYFTRDALRILVSLDLHGEDMFRDKAKRKDHDYAVSWIREYGKGKVFYTNLGHNESTFMNPIALQHMVSGIQYAFGDIEADATPSAKIGKLPKAPPAEFLRN